MYEPGYRGKYSKELSCENIVEILRKFHNLIFPSLRHIFVVEVHTKIFSTMYNILFCLLISEFMSFLFVFVGIEKTKTIFNVVVSRHRYRQKKDGLFFQFRCA